MAKAQTDPGPMARLAEVKRDPCSMGIIIQRLADGETIADIAEAWAVPKASLWEWVRERGRLMVVEADRQKLLAPGPGEI